MTEGHQSSAPARLRMTVGRSLVWFGLCFGVAVTGYLGINAVASRLLGRADFGYFIIAVTATGLASQVGLLGAHRAGLREVARLSPGDDGALSRLRSEVRAVCLVTLPIAAVIAATVTFFVANGTTTTRMTLAVTVVALVVLGGQQSLWANYLRGFGQIRFASLLEGRSGGAVVAVLQVVLLFLVWQLLPGWGLAGALAAVAVGYVAPVWLASRRAGRQWRLLPVGLGLRAALASVFRRDWRFATIQVANYSNGFIELWLAGILLSRVDASLFGAAQRLAFVLGIPMTIMQVVLAPVISRLWSSGELHQLERLVRTGSSVTGVVALLCWLPLLVAPGPILRVVYGPGFTEAALLLVLLSCVPIANALSGPCGTVLSMSHHEGVYSATVWTTLILRLPLNVAAALLFGPLGLAASAAICTAGMYAGLWIGARRRVGINTLPTLRPALGLLRRTSA